MMEASRCCEHEAFMHLWLVFIQNQRQVLNRHRGVRRTRCLPLQRDDSSPSSMDAARLERLDLKPFCCTASSQKTDDTSGPPADCE
ncbi:hypothetical protein VZT92_017455 [Zoarces viviparus]|uniref:Uncharacterized protein n=1 Tax=Zoarces viviparus TaxID=48416 RepID=A0AAW1ERB3_ZOAVI